MVKPKYWAVLVLIPLFGIVTTADAGLFDKIKEATNDVLDTVKDVSDTVVTGREAKRQTEEIVDSFQYNDSFTPSAAEVRLLQAKLRQQGYTAATPDGRLGKGTREAIRLYQSTTGATADGSLSYALFQQITTRNIPNRQPARLSRAEWLQFQQMLNSLGYDAGPADGLPGKRTRRAIANFLRENGLNSTSDRDGFDAIQRSVNPALAETPVQMSRNESTPNDSQRTDSSSVSGVTNAVTSNADTALEASSGGEPFIATELGGLYRQLMQVWLNVLDGKEPKEILAATYDYAFAAHEQQSGYCDELSAINSYKGNSIQAKEKLIDIVQTYDDYKSRTPATALPLDVRLQFTVRGPYDDYDLSQEALKLNNRSWSTNVDLADGRDGIDYTACRSVLGLPAKAQIVSTTVVPQSFKFTLREMVVQALVAAGAKDNNSAISESQRLLHVIPMSQDTATQLLAQPGASARLKITADIRVQAADPLEQSRVNRGQAASALDFQLLRMSSVDESTGVAIHELNFAQTDEPTVPAFLVPRLAAPESGLPDGLAYFDGAVVVYPPNTISQYGTTAETQVALHRLEQKLMLQAQPALSANPDTVYHFADLAEQNVDNYFVRKPLREANTSSYSKTWADVPKSGEFETRVVVGWQPTESTFADERLRQSFASEYGETLAANPIALPLEFVQLREIQIRTYDMQRRGFPLQAVGGANLQISHVAVARDPGLSGQFDMRSALKPIAPIKRLPDIWAMAPEQAEILQSKLPFRPSGPFERWSDEQIAKLIKENPSMKAEMARQTTATATLAVRMRVTGYRYQPPRAAGSRAAGVGQLTLDMDLVSLTVHDGPSPGKLLGTIEPPADAVMATVDAPGWSADDPKRLEPDNVRLLYLDGDDGSALPASFWRSAAEQRKQFEKLVIQNSWSAYKALPPYWGTLFPRSALKSNEPLSDQQVNDYRAWSLERGKFVGRNFYASYVGATVDEQGQLLTKDLGERVMGRLAGILRDHGINDRASEKTRKSMQQSGLAEARARFPDSSDWSGLYIGEDMVAGIALQTDAAWFEQAWANDSSNALSSGEQVAGQLLVRVAEVHRFTTDSGKPGVAILVAPVSVNVFKEGAAAITYSPVKPAGTPVAGDPAAARLDILGVAIGDSVNAAVETITASFEGEVVVTDFDTDDPALTRGIRIQLAEKAADAPESIVDLFVDSDRQSILAVGRLLKYGNLGIEPVQIANSLVDRYGEADGSKTGDNPGDAHYLAWGQGPTAALKLKNTRALYDGCILYPARNYKANEIGRISTHELKSPCGTYLLAYSGKTSTTFLLLDTIDTLERKAATQARLEEEKQEKLKSKVKTIKF